MPMFMFSFFSKAEMHYCGVTANTSLWSTCSVFLFIILLDLIQIKWWGVNHRNQRWFISKIRKKPLIVFQRNSCCHCCVCTAIKQYCAPSYILWLCFKWGNTTIFRCRVSLCKSWGGGCSGWKSRTELWSVQGAQTRVRLQSPVWGFSELWTDSILQRSIKKAIVICYWVAQKKGDNGVCTWLFLYYCTAQAHTDPHG